MKPRQLLVASVSAVWLAACAAASVATAASPSVPLPASNEAASALLSKAVDFQRQGAYPAAISTYTEALKEPLSLKMRVIALYNRAVAHQQAGQTILAIEDFNNALLLNPELSHAYYGRANAMRQTGNHLEALADYQKAAQYKYPHTHLPLFGQALTYESLNRPLSAEKLLQDTLQLRPDFAPAKEKLTELRNVAALKVDIESAAEAKISVAVNTKSVYGAMTKRIDQIVVGSVSPIAADQVVRKAFVSKPVRPPLHLLDAAEQVDVATVVLPGLQSISFSQMPASISPGFVVSQKTRVPKVQDRIPQQAHDLVASADLLIQPVSAPVEFKTRAMEQVTAAMPAAQQVDASQLDGFLVQINSQRNEDAAWAAWSKLKLKHGKLLAGREAIVQKADLGTDGIVYRLRIKGLSTKTEASSLCGKLKTAGLACFVAKAGA
jgi:tetratricopeptide (TPR) repeat protein